MLLLIESENMQTLGIHHLGLNVGDLNATTAFFVDCLGWSLVEEVPDYPASFVSNGEAFFTLWQASPNASQFDRKGQVGLHHVAIRVSDEQALSEIFNRVLNYFGVYVEFSTRQIGLGPAMHCMNYKPASSRMEFIWAPLD